MNQSPGEPTRFSTIHDAPVEMLPPERVLLYALVFGIRPDRCLEIGTLYGGSAAITVAALDDAGGDGRLVCVDPEPRIADDTWAGVSHRATLITGRSPEALSEARHAAGGPFDFAVIDGDHSTEGLVRDVEGVIDVLAPGAHMLLHDANFYEVSDGVDDLLRRLGDQLIDCGMLSRASVAQEDASQPRPVFWGGFRMLRFVPSTNSAGWRSVVHRLRGRN